MFQGKDLRRGETGGRTWLVRAVALFIVGGLFWYVVGRVGGVAEPWDAPAYWHLFYPLSLALSGIAGCVLRSRGWMAGVIVTFAQLPVMWIATGTGPLWAVAIMLLCVLAVPATAISMLAGWLTIRLRPRSR